MRHPVTAKRSIGYIPISGNKQVDHVLRQAIMGGGSLESGKNAESLLTTAGMNADPSHGLCRCRVKSVEFARCRVNRPDHSTRDRATSQVSRMIAAVRRIGSMWCWVR